MLGITGWMRVVQLRLAVLRCSAHPTCPNERGLGPGEARRDTVPLDGGLLKTRNSQEVGKGEEGSFLPFSGDGRVPGRGLSLVSIILNIYFKVLDAPGP